MWKWKFMFACRPMCVCVCVSYPTLTRESWCYFLRCVRLSVVFMCVCVCVCCACLLATMCVCVCVCELDCKDQFNKTQPAWVKSYTTEAPG